MEKEKKAKIKTEMDKEDKTILLTFCAFLGMLIFMKLTAIWSDTTIALIFIAPIAFLSCFFWDFKEDIRYLGYDKERVRSTKNVRIKRIMFLISEVVLWSLMLINSLVNRENSHLIISVILMTTIGFSYCKYSIFLEKNVDNLDETDDLYYLYTILYAYAICLVLLIINIIQVIVRFLC